MMSYICYITYCLAVFRYFLFYGFGWNWGGGVEISNNHPVGLFFSELVGVEYDVLSEQFDYFSI
jgi:hypothetical protein